MRQPNPTDYHWTVDRVDLLTKQRGSFCFHKSMPYVAMTPVYRSWFELFFMLADIKAFPGADGQVHWSEEATLQQKEYANERRKA